MESHEFYMSLALEEAKKAVNEGNAPFGAILVNSSGKIVSKGHDTVNTSCDSTAHAELSAIRNLCISSKIRKHPGLICYSTSEPCPMCLAACLKADIQTYYYGAEMEKSASLYIKAADIAKHFKRFDVYIYGGILKEETNIQRKNGLSMIKK